MNHLLGNASVGRFWVVEMLADLGSCDLGDWGGI
jgi:hypothetical protein